MPATAAGSTAAYSVRNTGHGHSQPCDCGGFHNHVTLTFGLWVSACQVTAIEYTCTKFNVDSSNRFTITVRTNKQTDRETNASEHNTHVCGYAGVNNDLSLLTC